MKSLIFKKGVLLLALMTLLSFAIVGCSQASATPASKSNQPKSTEKAKSNDSSINTTNTPSTAQTTATKTTENLYIVIEPGAKLGPDGKLHDAFINGDIKITEGQPVTLNFLNYDGGTHTYTSQDLGINVKIKGSEQKGKPALTTYTFTPQKTGEFDWSCLDPCDGENNQWAMVHDGYMKGKITVLPETNKTQYVSLVINAGIKLGSDNKLHDSFTPGDFTVKAGQPVELTVYNYDGGEHSFTSKDLNVDLAIKGHIKKGEASVQTVTFTPEKAGKYQWNCMKPCDGEANDWAMAQDNYMMGYVTVQE